MYYIKDYNHFHGYLDTELFFQPGRVDVTKETKYVIIQERYISYRFYLHQHPYVQQLVQRLLRKGTFGLEAADTEYKPDKTSLPGSLEISLNKNASVTVTLGSRIALLADLTATSGAVSVNLSADMEFKLAGDVQATAPNGMKTLLVEGMANTPSVDAVFSLSLDSKAVLSYDANIKFTAATPISLYDGKQVTLPAGTMVLLTSGALCTIPNGTQITLLKSKPRPVLYEEVFSSTQYDPSTLVQHPYPVKDLDFTPSGAYSVYNWELFFHVPMTIAIHLSKNQRFADAQHWFHYLFDPTDDSDGPTPERFWKVRPFQYTDVKKIEEIMVNLTSGVDETLRKETIRSIEAWKNTPFRPHVIARYRQQAYMYKTVMAYLDNLIAWGDSLFRQDTGEAIDEAMMLYVLAANILGPRPQPVPKKGSVRPQTYANLRQDLKQFGTVMRDVEADLPFDLMPFPTSDAGNNDRLAILRSLGKALYFCMPRNDKLLSYWDTVADRLFKIRNSLNFKGVFRQLALFEPPIDPALLARAAAAGLDVGAIVNGLNQPLPLVRFQFLVQKAAEIVQEVKSLGNNLLSTMEKEDNEALAILRAKHERVIMEMVEHVRYGQLQEAIKSKEGLLQSLALAVQRYTYYERQLGKELDEIEKTIPELEELDKESLNKMKFAMQEPGVGLRESEVDIASDLGASGGKIVSSHEQQEFKSLENASKLRQEAANLDMIAKFLSLIPEMGAQAQPMGVGAAIQFGGRALSMQLSLAADGTRIMSERDTFEAGKSAKIGIYTRREHDWSFQSNLAVGEITQIFKQLRAAQIREAIAEQELKNHQVQIKHAEEIEFFLTGEKNSEWTQKIDPKEKKTTNKALYTWMKREVKGLYSQCFQFAFDIARKAERALQHELGNPELNYLQFGYLAGKEGLLAGEKLYLDVKRMEMAYHEFNQREYELTKHISLLQVDPMALLTLRMTGKCTVRLSESLFDMDGPGHYFRRIKTVAVSIPCVTGPYASVNCKLTLLKSSIRKTQILRENVYAREDAEDDRFNDYFGSLQSIVTSSSQNDSGLFETNLHDERYLPFENSGVISEWQLELPANPSKGDPCQFDYQTISDVILHIRYTAREGGELLRSEAVKELINNAESAGSIRLFSVRNEFPTEWARFKSQTPANNQRFELTINLQTEHYPFWSKGRLNGVANVDILARSTEDPIPETLYIFNKADQTAKKETLIKDTELGKLLVGKFTNKDTGIALPTNPVGDFKLFFKENSISDLWIAITWSK
jgi:Tc toxin complex TcA C-terminal TcB-binding domain